MNADQYFKLGYQAAFEKVAAQKEDEGMGLGTKLALGAAGLGLGAYFGGDIASSLGAENVGSWMNSNLRDPMKAIGASLIGNSPEAIAKKKALAAKVLKEKAAKVAPTAGASQMVNRLANTRGVGGGGISSFAHPGANVNAASLAKSIHTPGIGEALASKASQYAGQAYDKGRSLVSSGVAGGSNLIQRGLNSLNTANKQLGHKITTNW